MIGVIGQMSSGKSYYAVECMLDWLLSGHPVCTNIRLKCQAVTSFLCVPCIQWKRNYFYLCDNPTGFNQIQTEDYESYPVGSPRGSADYERSMVYIVLDEASSIFDSMVHSSDASITKVAAWARHTMKRGQMLYLLMQFPSELHKRLRVHITEYVFCYNSSTLRIPFIGFHLPWFLRGMSIRKRLMSDAETPIDTAQWFKFRSEIYDCYDTSQIVVGSQIGAKHLPVKYDFTIRRIAIYTRLISFLLFFDLVICFGVVLWLMIKL